MKRPYRLWGPEEVQQAPGIVSLLQHHVGESGVLFCFLTRLTTHLAHGELGLDSRP